MNGVTKETFREYPVENKLDTMFDYIESIHGILDCRKNACEQRAEDCDIRITKIEKTQTRWKFFSTTTAFFGGMFGGILAWVTSKFYSGQ